MAGGKELPSINIEARGHDRSKEEVFASRSKALNYRIGQAISQEPDLIAESGQLLLYTGGICGQWISTTA